MRNVLHIHAPSFSRVCENAIPLLVFPSDPLISLQPKPTQTVVKLASLPSVQWSVGGEDVCSQRHCRSPTSTRGRLTVQTYAGSYIMWAANKRISRRSTEMIIQLQYWIFLYFYESSCLRIEHIWLVVAILGKMLYLDN